MRMHLRQRLMFALTAWSLAVGGLTGLAVAAPATAAPEPAPPQLVSYERYRLDNGLEVLLHRDDSLPLVAVNLWYHVGPINEPKGRSGFAHLFEHLMFEGSRHVGPNFDRLLESVGATNANGTTSWDRTNYFETVPSHQLPLALWIESDRMGFLLESIDQQRLDVQRDVVMNERRQSYENAPYGPSSLAMLDTLFPAGHPYHGAVIGSMEDLRAASLADVRAFFKDYYAPSNATLALAGRFEIREAKQLIERYFGGLRKSPAVPAAASRPSLPAATGRLEVKENVTVAKIAFGWLAPPAYSADHAPLEVAVGILAGGKATRLYRRLVVDTKQALEVDADLDANRLATMVTVDALARSGVELPALEANLASVVAELGAAGPTALELARAKRRLLLDLSDELQLLNGPGGESGRAGLLQRFNHYQGAGGDLSQWKAALEAVTRDDVRRVVHQHLSPQHQLTVVTLPTPNTEVAK